MPARVPYLPPLGNERGRPRLPMWSHEDTGIGTAGDTGSCSQTKIIQRRPKPAALRKGPGTAPEFKPRYNITPSSNILILRRDGKLERTFQSRTSAPLASGILAAERD